MTTLTVQSTDIHSYQFLQEQANTGRFFTITSDDKDETSWSMTSSTQAAYVDAQGYLFIYAEHLSVSKVMTIVESLNAYVSPLCYSLKRLGNDAAEVSVCVAVDLNTQDDIACQLEQLASDQYAEISLVSAIPSLNQPGVLLMDMDSTVIDMECIDEIAKLAGVGDKVSEVTELAMQGKLDFTQSLHERVACLKGVEVDLLQGIRDRLPLMPGITRLLSALQNQQWTLAIASGGFTFFADHLKQRLNLDFAISNVLSVEDGKLTGQVIGGVVDAQVKADTLQALARQNNIATSQTIALGDGANDLVMMSVAGLGMAYHAKPLVRQQADASTRFYGHEVLLHLLNHSI